MTRNQCFRMAEGSASDGSERQFHRLPAGLDQVFREYNCVGSFFDELSASLRERSKRHLLDGEADCGSPGRVVQPNSRVDLIRRNRKTNDHQADPHQHPQLPPPRRCVSSRGIACCGGHIPLARFDGRTLRCSLFGCRTGDRRQLWPHHEHYQYGRGGNRRSSPYRVDVARRVLGKYRQL